VSAEESSRRPTDGESAPAPGAHPEAFAKKKRPRHRGARGRTKKFAPGEGPSDQEEDDELDEPEEESAAARQQANEQAQAAEAAQAMATGADVGTKMATAVSSASEASMLAEQAGMV
jgi:hypothetical protein